ncbi:hypothetical protein F6V25_08020 [Oryzomonas japonica]|uniref:Uncharacterized protein n=1 Tax=Oryzomonas japonica TaxID=2603858 RepID=A0A7J4ZSH2_9BACT|nr:hypothetical protein [Oryzomonas japonica]KAB0665659.1 hypothetical protein F6V25_08020 [Oryzomonas japonica]
MIKCIGEILNAAKGAITRKEAEAIIAEIEKRFNAQMPKKDVSLSRRMDLKKDPAAMTTQERMVLAAEEAFNDTLKEKQNTVKRAQLQVKIQADAQQRIAQYGHGAKGVQEYLLRDVANKAKGIEELLMAELYQGLEPYMTATGHKMAVDQQLEVLKFIADPELHRRDATADASPAELLARAFRRMEDRVHARKNGAGADIGYIPGHFPQAWEPNSVRWFGLDWKQKLDFRPEWAGGKSATIARMREKARAAWVDYLMPKLDRSRYVDETTGQPLNDDQVREVMGNVWQTIASHGLSGIDPATAGGGGQTALAKQLAAHREIHFSDPAAFLEANNAFGSRDLFTAMVSNVRRHANEIAMLESLGPNPDSGFRTALAYGQRFGAEKTTFGREGSTLATHIWDEITGRSNMIAEDKFDLIARVMQGARNMITSAKLGMLPFSQVVDVAGFHAIATSDGLGMGEGYRAILQMLNPLNKADRELARKHGLLASMVINDVAMRYGDETRGVGWTSRAADATVTWSGAKFWTDSMLQAFQLLIGSHVAGARDLAFHELDPQFRLMMERNGITPEHWDIIRSAEAAKIGDFEAVTPWAVKGATSRQMDSAASIPGAAGARADVAAERMVQEAAERYAALLSDESRVAILHPNKKDQAYIKGATRAGETPGEFMRSVFLFKSFSLALLTRHVPRVFSGEYGPASSRAEVGAKLLVGMMLTGGLAVQLKEIFKGKNPRDMTDPAFWYAAFMQAGGLGIFGDFFLADANRFGGGFVSSVGGPVAGLIQDTQRLTLGNAQTAMDGKQHKKSFNQDFAGDAIQFAKNYAPMMNLWYTRLALDHLFFYQVQESINPGYLHRMKQRTRSENNQTFWWDPNSPLPESGPSLETAIGGN